MKTSRGRRTPLVAIACCLASGTFAWLFAAQIPATPRTVSPAEAAASILLLTVSPQPDAANQLRAALTHHEPVVRSAAARVVAAMDRKDLFEALAEVFSREANDEILAEQADALLQLRGADSLGIVESTLAKSPSALSVIETYTAWLARNQPERFIERMPLVVTLERQVVGRQLRLLAARNPLFKARAIDAASVHFVSEEWAVVADHMAFDSGTPPVPGLRSAPLLGPGVLPALLAATGCNARGEVGGAEVTISPTGQVTAVGIDSRWLSSRCAKALEAVARLAKADNDAPSGNEWIILLLDGEHIACVSDPAVYGRNPPRKIGATTKIKRPKAIRQEWANPPVTVVDKRVVKSVSVTFVISTTGCVTWARVTDTFDPGFDVSALSSVMRWRFEPTLVDGQPIPLVASIQMNFGGARRR